MGFQTPQFFLLTVAAFGLFWPSPKSRLAVLSVFNALFYLYAGLLDLGLFFSASVASYAAARLMSGRRRKAALAVGIGVNLLNLGFFKYYHFALGNISKFLRVPAVLSSLKIVLPIGISFYTFQLIAYLVDVYRRDVPPIESFVEFWVFIAFFGQVIAGPIMRAKDFSGQVAETERFRPEPENLKRGLVLFAVGLSKKLVLADTLSPIVDKYFARGSGLSSVDVWIAAYLFAFQIYYDFSAYSDMALGVGKLFGYNLTPNFDTPYLSQNPPEFWRRWHITLSSWIRDYLYIPMGGSRRGFCRGLAALMASMTISGMWHGASWNFVFWGMYHGFLSVLHRIWRKTLGARLPANRFLQVINTLGFFHLTVAGWVLFRVAAVRDLAPLLIKMTTFSDLGVGPHLREYAFLIVALYSLHWAENCVRRPGSRIVSWWNTGTSPAFRGMAYAVVILGLCVFLRPRASAFIYFQF